MVLALALPPSCALDPAIVADIEQHLRRYPDYLRARQERRLTLLYPRSEDGEQSRTALHWSDPTGSAVARLCDDTTLRDLERIITAITDELEAGTPRLRVFVVWRYWQRLEMRVCAARLRLNRRTMTRWNEALVAGVARRLGWG